MNNRLTYEVVIPTWNRPSQTIRAVQSVSSQELKPVRIIVVDDGSDQRDFDLMKHGLPSGVDLLQTGGREGAAAARNRGSEAATADCVLYLDSDDIWLPGHAETVVSILEEYADLAIAGSITLVDSSGVSLPYRTVSQPLTLPGQRSAAKDLRLDVALQMRAGLTATSCFGLRRDVFDRGFRFASLVEPLEDLDLVIQCLSAGLTVKSLRTLTVFREGRGGDHLFQSERALNALDELARRWESGIYSSRRTARRFLLNRARYSCICGGAVIEDVMSQTVNPDQRRPSYLRAIGFIQRHFGSRAAERLCRLLQLIPIW